MNRTDEICLGFIEKKNSHDATNLFLHKHNQIDAREHRRDVDRHEWIHHPPRHHLGCDRRTFRADRHVLAQPG